MSRLTPEQIAVAAADFDVRNLLACCTSLASEFEARRNRVRNFVQHNLTSGTANEAILRTFLASISGGLYGVSEGFVCNPIRRQSSRQCDILVYDRHFPFVYADGEVTIVWPEATLMTIEVKTAWPRKPRLQYSQIHLVSPQIARLPYYSSSKAQLSSRQTSRMCFATVAVTPRTNSAGVLARTKSALVLTYLLLLFLRRQFSRAPGFSSSEDLLMATEQFLLQNTTQVERTA